MEATVIQTGIGQKVEAVKQFYADKAKEAARKRIQVSHEVLITGSVVYTAVVKQEISITFRAQPIAHSMSVRADLNSVRVGLAWGF